MADKPSASVTPESAAALELAIQERRNHLAATIDELTARAKPADIARRTLAGVQIKVRTITHGPDGALRKERLSAVAGASVVLAGVMFILRRRRRK